MALAAMAPHQLHHPDPAVIVTRAMFPDIVRGALKDHCHKTNPRVASDTDYEAMLEASV